MPNRATKQLSGDHQLILQALEVLREMTGHVERGEIIQREDLHVLLEFFREFVHNYHDGKEQSILIPALLEAGQTLHEEPLSKIISDHHEIHGLIADLASAALAQNDILFANLSDQYTTTLANHIYTEDQILFGAMDSSLNDISDHKMWKMFNDFEPALRERSKAKFEAVVKNLGRKYSQPLCV